MEIVDAQLHEPGPFLEWDPDPELRRKVFTEATLMSMDAAGVDAALLFPAEDEVWAGNLAAESPHRFAMVPRIASVEASDLDDTMSAELDRAGVVGVRFLTWNPGSGNPIELERENLTADIERGKFDRALGIAAERGLTVFIYANGMLEQAALLASRWPDTQFVVDHLGILQPPMEVPEEPRLRSLPKLLDLAERDNVAVKFCGLPGLSMEGYPFRDVHDAARQITDAFGADRLMWGSDIWRFRGRIGYKYRIPGAQGAYPGKHTYAESVGFIRDTEIFDETEKALLLGGTARALLKWDGETNTTAEPN